MKPLLAVLFAVVLSAQTPDPPKKKVYTQGQRNFWSFKAIKDPAITAPSPIDAFILAKLEEKKLKPAKRASKLALIRRATFDLTGLPPTEPEIEAFLADDSPTAFASVVDRLLASPRYGEKWGRHWLDVARYADSTGADEDHRYPYAWRYRDYVIDAFNRDLPYNQFVKEQIAGDLMPAPDGKEVNVEGITATGFLSIGPRLIAEQDKPKMLYDFIDEQIDTTTRGILGLTVACARCHDHKFDPIATADYYSLAAIFANTKAFSKIGKGGVSEIYYAPLAPADVVLRYVENQAKVATLRRQANAMIDAEIEQRQAPLRARVAEYMMATRHPELADGLDPVVLARWKKFLTPDKDPNPLLSKWHNAKPEEEKKVALAFQHDFDEQFKEYSTIMAQWNAFVSTIADGTSIPVRPPLKDGDVMFYKAVTLDKDSGPLALPDRELMKLFPDDTRLRIAYLRARAEDMLKDGPQEPPMACAVTEGRSVQQHVLVRGNPASPGDPVTRRFPTILAGDDQPELSPGSGRLEFAQWLASPKNPLTARVFVNRVWQWHFGEGLVRTPSNWGLLGEKPTHPELLDYLAARFIEDGWSVKKLHRRIMLSDAYQMSSDISAEAAEQDPGNRFLSHFSRRRLDVEEVRDSMLALDGSLDLKMGGTLQRGTGTDGENSAGRLSIDPATSKRRTVYLPLRRSNLPSLLNLFDFGDATTTCEGRALTNTAPQALFMMNSAFVNDRSAALAKELAGHVDLIYQRILGRLPTANEKDDALAYIEKTGERGWQSLCRILLSSNEFIYVD
jgi:hypothetical protein|nr:DUF1549 and DUF1553 domain-containing protein [Bryobacteraceae bacterium]